MRINIGGTHYTYDRPVVLKDIATELKVIDVLAATVNGRLRELSFILTKDADVNFLKYDNGDAIRIYESTLRYVIAMAIKNLYPNAKVKFNYSISRSILAVLDHFEGAVDAKLVDKIKNEVNALIKKDLLIERKRVSVGEATKLYTELDMPDKVSILEYRE